MRREFPQGPFFKRNFKSQKYGITLKIADLQRTYGKYHKRMS